MMVTGATDRNCEAPEAQRLILSSNSFAKSQFPPWHLPGS